jgi:hypothetical protein
MRLYEGCSFGCNVPHHPSYSKGGMGSIARVRAVWCGNDRRTNEVVFHDEQVAVTCILFVALVAESWFIMAISLIDLTSAISSLRNTNERLDREYDLQRAMFGLSEYYLEMNGIEQCDTCGWYDCKCYCHECYATECVCKEAEAWQAVQEAKYIETYYGVTPVITYDLDMEHEF